MRTKKTEQITFRVSTEFKQALAAIALEEDRTPSKILEMLAVEGIRQYISKHSNLPSYILDQIRGALE